MVGGILVRETLSVTEILIDNVVVGIKGRPRLTASLAEPRPRHVRVVARLDVRISDVGARVDRDVGVPFARDGGAAADDADERRRLDEEVGLVHVPNADFTRH